MRRTHALRPVLAELTRLPVVERIELQPMDEGEVRQLFTAIRGRPAATGRGRPNRAIAEELFISEKTVSVHVSNIMAKLGAANRTEAGAKARALGLDQL